MGMITCTLNSGQTDKHTFYSMYSLTYIVIQHDGHYNAHVSDKSNNQT